MRNSRNTPDLHERALPQLQEAALGNPRLGGLLAEIERGRERRDKPVEETRSIADMRVDETAYTVPWAMLRTKSDGLCLRPSFPVQDAPRGTAQMRVMRTVDGFHVWWNDDTDRQVEWLDGSLPVIEVAPR
jgi:hypothetical protein